MIKRITFNEDHLKLIPFLLLEENDDDVIINKHVALSLQSHLLDDVSLILGLRDYAIKGTENDAEGMAFPDDVEKRMVDCYKFVTENLFDIETIIHQFAVKGGISVGTYKCDDLNNIWVKETINFC